MLSHEEWSQMIDPYITRAANQVTQAFKLDHSGNTNLLDQSLDKLISYLLLERPK